MEDFRLAVNRPVRAGLQAKVTSRYGLVKLLYKDFRQDHPGMYAQHLVSSFEVAGSLTLLPDRVIIAFRKGEKRPYEPERGARPEPNGTNQRAGVA